jgi:ferredoxin-NADP reductase
VIDVRLTLTRAQPDGWRGYGRRIDRELLAEVAWPPSERPLIYVCGPTGFVETAASLLVALGHEPSRIRTERFGPTGG